MKEKKCKTCGTNVLDSEEFCPECGCRCKQPTKITPVYAFMWSVVTFCSVLISLAISTVSGSHYNNMYVAVTFGIITIILSIISFIKNKLLLKNSFSVLISIVAIVIAVMFQNFNITVLTFTTDVCDTLFDISTEEFEKKNGYGTIFYENIISVKLDKDSNLVLKIDRKQKEKLEKKCLLEISEARSDDILFSQNYDKITVKVYQETVSDLLTAHQTVRYCVFYQLLNDKSIEDVNVNFVLLDAGNGKELVNFNWPESESNLEITIDTENISSRGW